jgi:hypothetical protein
MSQANGDASAAGDDPVQQLVVLRQLELALIALAAGRTEMATRCVGTAEKWAGGDPQYAAGIELMKRLLGLRNTIFLTVAQRMPLLEKVGEIPIDKTFASVIAATADQVVLRFEGQRRELPLETMPWSVVAGILQVTSGTDPGADQVQQALIRLLRARFQVTGEEQAALDDLSGLIDRQWESAQFPLADLQQIRQLAAQNGQFSRFLNLAGETNSEPWVEDWSSLYIDSRENVKNDRDWQKLLRDENVSRYELEEAVWQRLSAMEPSVVAGHLFHIHHLAMGRGDLTFLLDNLQRLDRSLTLLDDHVMWADMGRALLANRRDDALLVADLTRLQDTVQSDPAIYSTGTITGLKRVGKQAAQRLTRSPDRRHWVKVFE